MFVLFPSDTKTRLLLLKLFIKEKLQRRSPRKNHGLQEKLQCYLGFNIKI